MPKLSRLDETASRLDALGITLAYANDPVDGSKVAVIGWREAARLLDMIHPRREERLSGRGPWCKHFSCAHWFEPDCDLSCSLGDEA